MPSCHPPVSGRCSRFLNPALQLYGNIVQSVHISMQVTSRQHVAVLIGHALAEQFQVATRQEPGRIGLHDLGFINVSGVVVQIIFAIDPIRGTEVTRPVTSYKTYLVVRIALDRTITLILNHSQAIHLHFIHHQVVITVDDLPHAQPQIIVRLDPGTDIMEGIGPRRGLTIFIQDATDRHVAAAVNQRPVPVGDGGGAKIQPLPRRHHRRIEAITNVVDVRSLDRQVRTIQSPAVTLLKIYSLKLGELTVNDTGIVDGMGLQVGLLCAISPRFSMRPSAVT